MTSRNLARSQLRNELGRATGILGKVRIPGQGVIAATFGRQILRFPLDGGEPTVTFTGTNELFGSPGDPGVLCDLLA